MEKVTARKKLVEMNPPTEKLGLPIRSGVILPTQKPNVTTTYTQIITNRHIMVKFVFILIFFPCAIVC